MGNVIAEDKHRAVGTHKKKSDQKCFMAHKTVSQTLVHLLF